MDLPQKPTKSEAFPFSISQIWLILIKTEPSLNLTEALSCGSAEGTAEVADGSVMSCGSHVGCVT